MRQVPATHLICSWICPSGSLKCLPFDGSKLPLIEHLQDSGSKDPSLPHSVSNHEEIESYSSSCFLDAHSVADTLSTTLSISPIIPEETSEQTGDSSNTSDSNLRPQLDGPFLTVDGLHPAETPSDLTTSRSSSVHRPCPHTRRRRGKPLFGLSVEFCIRTVAQCLCCCTGAQRRAVTWQPQIVVLRHTSEQTVREWKAALGNLINGKSG